MNATLLNAHQSRETASVQTARMSSTGSQENGKIAHMLAAERAVSSAICIVIIVVGRRSRGIIVYKPQGHFGSANVTSTDVTLLHALMCNRN
jgi:hypothetical protein